MTVPDLDQLLRNARWLGQRQSQAHELAFEMGLACSEGEVLSERQQLAAMHIIDAGGKLVGDIDAYRAACERYEEVMR